MSRLHLHGLALALALASSDIALGVLVTNPAAPAASYATVAVGYDTVYDAPDTPMSAVACSDGVAGLLPLGFPTFRSLPSFPRIGAISSIAGWNSSACGTCWELRSTCPDTRSSSASADALEAAGAADSTSVDFVPGMRIVHFLAVDHADAASSEGLQDEGEVVFTQLEEATLSRQAMDMLTCGHAVQLGVVEAAYREVDPAMCGL
ncbi:Cerato-platanin-domain-containing protein [Schizophyllum amplum]|uniref:Cerato-platanin-domain-containing protein n=1 Tax=Schizophyllum amplum TaxID=97359 RepID=A0A550C4T4_9AGAR|nr:Cerato-platanin-domain-containing protein [Auriculariopsis ampla]